MGKKFIITESQCAIIESLIKISSILMKKSGCHFKIGKTSNIEKRFDSEYKCKYREIIPIYTDENFDLISELETVLIKYYKQYYPELCDNTNEGEGEKSDERFNCVYMVIQ